MDYNPNSPKLEGRTKPVLIHGYFFIGRLTMIMRGVTLKNGFIVAAGAIVTKDVAEKVVVAGEPAYPIGMRNANYNYTVNYGRLFK